MPFATLLFLGALVANPSTPPLDNLSFASGRLTGWEGNGFAIGPTAGSGPTLHFGVNSGDRGPNGHKALLYRTIVVPAGVSALSVRVAAVRPPGRSPGPALDLFLEAAERQIIPKLRRTPTGWQTAAQVGQGTPLRTEEIIWRLDGLAGHQVRIILQDDDDRPGCYLVCSGFRFVSRDEFATQEFTRELRRLAQEHRLGPVTRADTPHFIAVGTAEDSFVERRLDLCESLYETFFEHFRVRGLPVRAPQGKLFLAVFDNQEGMEAAMGQRMPATVTGLYQRTTNRLVVYDVGNNRALRETRERNQAAAQRLGTNDPERGRIIVEFDKRARTWRDDTNASTVLHETAHQLSFNCGLLNREGDVPLWLAEGLACYCEGPGSGWRGPGGPNPERAQVLAGTVRGNSPFLPLRALVENDDWFTRRPTHERVLLGYAQSWALFRLLMEERSPSLRRYLSLVYERRSPEQRLADFVEAFGDLGQVEARYQVYLRDLAAKGATK
jgi:hypothetical protein